MKIEQLIVQHLYNNKKVTLQDIGSFILSSNVSMPPENEKDGVMPENAITFEYNTRAMEDESLIDFIVQQTRKIKPLATSDLESYCILGREYLNIGKPFPIEGLGTLQKNQSGQYEFIQGNSVNPKLQAAPALLKEKDDEEIVFSTPPRKQNRNKSGMIIAGLVFLALTVAALVYFLNKKETDQPVSEQVVAADTTTVAKRDSVITPPAADTIARSRIPGDTSTFKVVLKEYPSKQAADMAFTKLSGYGHTLMVYQKDSSTYRLAMPFTTPLSDTARAKDSLNRFFGGKTYIDLR
jgi:hypothetical protein